MSSIDLHRKNVFERMPEGSIMVVFAGAPKIASGDEDLPFVINKNFFYLTDISQENSILMFIKTLTDKKTYLFVDENDPVKEKWYGKKLTVEEAKNISGLNDVFLTKEFESILSLTLTNVNNQYGFINKLYLDLSPEIKVKENTPTSILAEELKEKYPHIEIVDLMPLLTSLRVIKDSDEIERLQEAIDITNNGLNDLILHVEPGQKEFEVSDRFEFYGRSHGRKDLSFSTIVASGKNACILHYPVAIQNEKIGPEDLILCDLGFQSRGYHADITRTYPVSGKFTPLQRKIYQAVLNCNKAAIEYAKPGISLRDLQDFTVNFLRNECIKEKLMEENDDIRKYYYHSISHHLGLDTHDVGGRDTLLEPGQVITIEPGLYFANYGIGVRVEDDILITNERPIVLSSGIKKEIEDIEKLFAAKEKM